MRHSAHIAVLIGTATIVAACASGSTPHTAPKAERRLAHRSQPSSSTTSHAPSTASTTTSTTRPARDPQACAGWFAADDATVAVAADARDGTAQRASFRAAGGTIRRVGNRYAATWAPPGWAALETRRVLIQLHGTGGYPELEWKDWYQYLGDGTWATVGLMYRDGANFDDARAIYGNVSALVDGITAACGTDTAIHIVGFSRGSANTFPVAQLDRRAGGTIRGAVSVSGAWTARDPLPPVLSAVASDPLAMGGTQFWGWCGESDREHGGPMCDEMTSAFDWVTQHGGTVATLRHGAGLGHADFPEDGDGVRAALAWLASLPPR